MHRHFARCLRERERAARVVIHELGVSCFCQKKSLSLSRCLDKSNRRKFGNAPRGAVHAPLGGFGRSRALRIFPRRVLHAKSSRLRQTCGPQTPRDHPGRLLRFEIVRDQTTRSEGTHRPYLDIPPCKTRRGDIRRARGIVQIRPRERARRLAARDLQKGVFGPFFA